jgi:hypothetical protein
VVGASGLEQRDRFGDGPALCRAHRANDTLRQLAPEKFPRLA